MSFVVIIPARFASTRLPGKPLQDINGKPMIVHVLERARESGADRIIVATDHEDVARAVEAAGGEVCMTRADHQSGTERLAEVVEKCAFSDDTIIVNIQGDEPMIPPAIVRQVAENLAASKLHFVVQTASIDTGIGQRDEHLKSADFFEAGKYPTMEFTSTSINLKDGVYEAKGEALVKGKKYPLTIPFSYFEAKKHPMMEGAQVMGLNAELPLDRLIYGIGDEKMLGVVGQKADVLITLELLDK